MPEAGEKTLVLLQRLQGGDQEALRALLARDLPWVRGYVSRRLGTLLRGRADVDDYVQEAMADALRHGPRFATANLTHFRSLLARITENVLRDQAAHWRRKARDVARERPGTSDSLLELDQPVDSVTRPSVAAHRDEERAWIRLAIELLPASDREVVRMREWEELSFAEIGRELGATADGARMRFHRVLPKLARNVELLRSGQVARVLAQEPDPS
jgi:RNA polymerase sigma-70 factor (ECF subfamily)